MKKKIISILAVAALVTPALASAGAVAKKTTAKRANESIRETGKRRGNLRIIENEKASERAGLRKGTKAQETRAREAVKTTTTSGTNARGFKVKAANNGAYKAISRNTKVSGAVVNNAPSVAKIGKKSAYSKASVQAKITNVVAERFSPLVSRGLETVKAGRTALYSYVGKLALRKSGKSMNPVTAEAGVRFVDGAVEATSAYGESVVAEGTADVCSKFSSKAVGNWGGMLKVFGEAYREAKRTNGRVKATRIALREVNKFYRKGVKPELEERENGACLAAQATARLTNDCNLTNKAIAKQAKQVAKAACKKG